MSRSVVDLQVACDADNLPDADDFARWVDLATEHLEEPPELTIRIVESGESRALNHQYRGKNYPTNVLSFPFEAPPDIELNLLGDLVICAEVVAREAAGQHKALADHWAHMVVHGTLHLLGYDHQEDDEAEEMEALERTLLARLGIPDPYQTSEEA